MSLLDDKIRFDGPFVMVILGATGDLTARKLVPALFDLYQAGYLPERFVVLGYARRDWSQAEFAAHAATQLEGKADQAKLKEFLSHFQYQQGDFTQPDDYQRLSDRLEQLDEEMGQCGRRLFYLATPAENYQAIMHGIQRTNLQEPCDPGEGWTRIIVEKPFGHDLHSAQELDGLVRTIFSEDQIYRIDHYLGKETAQNVAAFRFANSIFEQIWNAEHIERIEIVMKEERGVGTRGAFYDQTGALRDVVQNHLLQLLALVTMDEPKDRSAESFRNQRAKVLSELPELAEHQIDTGIILGQYEGYREEDRVKPESNTETFAAVSFGLEGKRWKGTEVLLMAGKALNEKATTIKVVFKSHKSNLYEDAKGSDNYNSLIINIQPKEGIELQLLAKSPGYGHRLQSVGMHFNYQEQFTDATTDAYSRLLLDAIEGDQTLFARSDEVEAQWRFIDPLVLRAESAKKEPVMYAKGSAGPDIKKLLDN